jgi:Kef-type K+ transport system membrane component KefB
MVLVGSVEATILVLFVVVVFGPHVAERLRVPGIVGLIFGGMLFGPFMIGWLEADGLVVDLGAIGILYLMFHCWSIAPRSSSGCSSPASCWSARRRPP